MKPSSTEPAPGLPEPTVRAVRFDRPLTRGGIGTSWGDPEVDRLVRQAIEDGQAQGRAQGYAAGWAQGRQAAAETARAEAAQQTKADDARRAQETARLAAVLTSLAQAAQTLDHTLVPAWEELADTITDGTLALARALLARELIGLKAPVLESVRAALHTLGDAGPIVVRLEPGDLVAVDQLGLGTLPAGVRLIADPTVPRGEVLASSPVQQLRLSLPVAVAAAEEVLRG